VPVVSWAAGVVADGGDGEGLAVLLDGPQGLSMTSDRLGISLLRSPTWPDPGADNGRRRQRLALMPASGGWRRAEVPRQAQRLREPLWIQPAGQDIPRHQRHAGDGRRWPGFPALAADLRLVAMRVADDAPEDEAEGAADDGGLEVVIAVQNEGPCRRRLRLAEPWRLVRRIDGLGGDREPGGEAAGSADGAELRPWELGFWRLRRSVGGVG
jgi:alpha-mannosidase